ncbi:hypothetical protein TCDM_09275 [Trypanosoma cruzi Dm28c]|uniref:Uncharacterized protein n=1 Tax=Trypanosoma cruzi Dm28c TaxID=1416333 RepID=V5B5W6_TRYCR|nr:hypothetical protein TCDM_09275 [Trypanosoma cruzi Dm28c]
MPAEDVTSGGMPPMISGQTIIGMGGHKRQQPRQQQEQLPLCCLREVNIPPATADFAIVTLHARRGRVNTSCSLLRLKRCLTPSTKCVGVRRAWAVRKDHNDVRVTGSQHVCCDVVAWHMHTHTRSACIPPVCVRPLPEWPHTRAAAKSLHPRRSKINADIPRDAKISFASTGLLPLCHRRRNTAQCTHLFSSRSVSRLLHTFFGGSTFTKARHKSHGDRTSSCDERRCVCACIRCSHMLAGGLQPVSSCQFIGSSTENRKRPIPDALIPTGSTNTLVASRHSSAHPGMRKSDVELSASNATIPHTFRLHQRRHTNHK